jgi:toxin ParE1/3/4
VAFKIIIAQAALKDLGEILDYIGADDPEAAARFGKGLLNHSQILTSFPHLGIVVKKRAKVRSLLHSPVRIYYQVDEEREAIQILHFWHTSRRPPKF